MKVLFISEYLKEEKGGGEKSAKKLIKAISKKVDCTVITSDRDFAVNDWKRLFYFPLHCFIQTLKIGKQHDVIHCLNSTSIYSILAKPFIKKPFVMHVNSYANLCPKGTLIFRDQTFRRQCGIECTLKECIDCCKDSRWVGVKEMEISKPFSILLWLRYKFHMFLIRYFDHVIPISKQAEKVCLKKGIARDRITQIYYGA